MSSSSRTPLTDLSFFYLFDVHHTSSIWSSLIIQNSELQMQMNKLAWRHIPFPSFSFPCSIMFCKHHFYFWVCGAHTFWQVGSQFYSSKWIIWFFPFFSSLFSSLFFFDTTSVPISLTFIPVLLTFTQFGTLWPQFM